MALINPITYKVEFSDDGKIVETCKFNKKAFLTEEEKAAFDRGDSSKLQEGIQKITRIRVYGMKEKYLPKKPLYEEELSKELKENSETCAICYVHNYSYLLHEKKKTEARAKNAGLNTNDILDSTYLDVANYTYIPEEDARFAIKTAIDAVHFDAYKQISGYKSVMMGIEFVSSGIGFSFVMDESGENLFEVSGISDDAIHGRYIKKSEQKPVLEERLYLASTESDKMIYYPLFGIVSNPSRLPEFRDEIKKLVIEMVNTDGTDILFPGEKRYLSMFKSKNKGFNHFPIFDMVTIADTEITPKNMEDAIKVIEYNNSERMINLSAPF
ncbi:hypothetical protein ACFL96_03275 [Thermoproteota archaeon]